MIVVINYMSNGQCLDFKCIEVIEVIDGIDGIDIRVAWPEDNKANTFQYVGIDNFMSLTAIKAKDNRRHKPKSKNK